jgi:molybdopterin/thiamine biosynthesis adenylyltransferase
MALAEYFERNAQAAAALVQGFDATLLVSRLGQEVVGLVYDATIEDSAEGEAALDLALRLVSRLYPTLFIGGLPGTKPAFLKRQQHLARSINPRIELSSDLGSATKLLAFGNTKVTGNRKAKAQTWYVGSDNWFAKLSSTAPVGSGSSGNPLGAGAAACVAVANIFRAVFVNELGDTALDTEVATSLLDLRPAEAGSANPALSSVSLVDVHLVGAGAIGNGALWALSRMRCEGKLHVVDHESVSDSNLQRYVMLVAADQTKPKAALAEEWLKPFNPRLTVVPHVKDWAAHVAGIEGHKVDTVLSAVDSADARIEIQASLPRVIYNGWTQRGEAGVSRHWFLGEAACLACLYLPTGQAPSEDVVFARALRLGEDDATVREVRRRLHFVVPTERAFLERIAAAAGVDVDKLAPFENRQLRELYVEGVCGGRVMEFHQAALQVKAEVPMGFQSALAGILLAAELARPYPLKQTMTQIDLLSTFPERPGSPRAKTLVPRCLCLDDDFIEVFKQKYGVGA